MPGHSFFQNRTIFTRCKPSGSRGGLAAVFTGMLIVLGCSAGVFAEGFFALELGLSAPRATRDKGLSGYAAWEGKLGWGGLSSSGVGAGGGITFLFQRTGAASVFDTIGTGDGWLIEEHVPEYEIKRTMIMPEFGLFFRLLSELPIHPIAALSTGPAVMIYTSTRYDDQTDETENSKHSGGYWGWQGTASAGVNIMLGDSDNSLFGLLQYRSCSVTKRTWDSNVRYRQDMSAPSIHIGIQFL